MRKLALPEVWLPLALLACAAGAAVWLAQPQCTVPAARDLEFYWARHYWRCAFDALSATCGCGLTTYKLEEAYTPAGRWGLAAAGFAGAVLYLAALWQMMRRILPAARRVGAGGVFAPFLALALVSFGTMALLQLIGNGLDWQRAAWNGLAATSSSGLFRSAGYDATTIAFIVLGFIAALGWPVWLLAVPSFRQANRPRPIVLCMVAYALFFVASAALVMLLETPRGWRTRAAEPGPALSQSPLPQRFARGLAQAAAAGGAGIATESFAERDASEGTKAIYGLIALLGGLAGSPAGTLHFTTLLAALAFGRRGRAPRPRDGEESAPGAENAPENDAARAAQRQRIAGAALTVLFWSAALTAVFALGLLLISGLTASPFDHPFTLGDAWLEAAAAFGGAGLSSGLTAALSDENLSAGMYQTVDLYQYGMVWLMLAMLLGRILPLWIWRTAAERPAAPPARR